MLKNKKILIIAPHPDDEALIRFYPDFDDRKPSEEFIDDFNKQSFLSDKQN